MEGFPSGDDGFGVWMNMASANALAVAVRAGMRGELERSARVCALVALKTVATDVPLQLSAALRCARQRIGNRFAQFKRRYSRCVSERYRKGEIRRSGQPTRLPG